ncbi:hypothetical protein [sulfur-oxidizing endosymbiont of Gigantopelta aegis]|uniref:hypothetical protein n=1 Tax=sulfur-oxidizing endosymbiont of Gigantopelta aegis TaxID=2794934 RepID=UPI0018DB4C80|nr:hypothetical protein [sulfur-oxidizing endosymbiont of Gigantopelta aegis]
MSKEAIRGSFDDVVESIDSTTAGHVPKRQRLNIVRDVAQDFEGFYKKNDLLNPKNIRFAGLNLDGKGIVMRPEGLRECTKKNAQKNKKLKSRLNQGEKKTENVWHKWLPFIPYNLIFVLLNLL